MPESDWETIQTKKGQGIGNVTEDQKNATIEKAERTWDKMGLTDEQKAFGIATIGLESGFDPNAKGSAKGSDEYGLGQFKRETWGDAVKHYNKQYDPDIDNADKARNDPDAQTKVMGAWVPSIWDRAGEIASDPNVKGYDQKQIAYGKWNQGQNAHAKGVGDYLKGNWHDPNVGGYFDTTYDRAMQALKIRKQRGNNQ